MDNTELELLDNGEAWTPDWLTWKERYEELHKQNRGLVDYANRMIEERNSAKRRELRSYHENLTLTTKIDAEMFEKECWRIGAILMLGIDFFFAVWMMTGGAQ